MVNEVVPRQPHEPTDQTRRQARTMAACGMSPEEICLVLGCDLSEFERHYRAIFRTGSLEANTAVGARVLQVAMDPDHDQFAQCAFFWLRARAGWRDVKSVEKTNKDLPEEQKTKLINAIVDRLKTESKSPEPEPVRRKA